MNRRNIDLKKKEIKYLQNQSIEGLTGVWAQSNSFDWNFQSLPCCLRKSQESVFEGIYNAKSIIFVPRL